MTLTERLGEVYSLVQTARDKYGNAPVTPLDDAFVALLQAVETLREAVEEMAEDAREDRLNRENL
jgi:hypothetical protein